MRQHRIGLGCFAFVRFVDNAGGVMSQAGARRATWHE
jgi:hypothetical protein